MTGPRQGDGGAAGTVAIETVDGLVFQPDAWPAPAGRRDRRGTGAVGVRAGDRRRGGPVSSRRHPCSLAGDRRARRAGGRAAGGGCRSSTRSVPFGKMRRLATGRGGRGRHAIERPGRWKAGRYGRADGVAVICERAARRSGGPRNRSGQDHGVAQRRRPHAVRHSAAARRPRWPLTSASMGATWSASSAASMITRAWMT